MALTPEEAAALGLPEAPAARKALSPDEAVALGLPTPPQKMGALKAGLLGGAQGITAGNADEIAGIAKAAPGIVTPKQQMTTPGPKALALLYPGLSYTDAAAKWFDQNRPDVAAATNAELARQDQEKRYRTERDSARQMFDKAQADQPGAYLGGNVLGMVASAPANMGYKAAAGLGAVQGLGYSNADDAAGTLRDSAIGTAGGLAGQAAGKVLASVGSKATGLVTRTLDKLRSKAGDQAAKTAEAEVASLTGKYGGLRQTENKAIREAAAMESAGTLNSENAALLAEARASGRFNEALNEALANDLQFLTKRTGEVQAAKSAADAARQALPQTIANETERLLSPEMAKEQVKARFKRYAVPVIGGATAGYLTSGDDPLSKGIGMGVGAAAGRGVSPMVQALIRMASNPAVETQMLKAAGSATQAATGPTTQALVRALAMQRAAAALGLPEEMSDAPRF